MQLKYKDSDFIFSKAYYYKDENKFKITPSIENENCEMYYFPVLKLDADYDVSNFSYELFYNESICENDIYQVYADKNRIGWIFPIQALLSSDHDYAEDKYFLKYAYVATWLLLSDINQVDQLDSPSEFVLEDYVDDKRCIFVLDHENISKIENFQLSDYTVEFFKYGYEYKGKGNFNPSSIRGTRRLNLHPLAKEIRGNNSINDLFTDQFLLASNSVVRFYICYQIIELLISKVFEDKFQLIVKKLSKNPEELFDLREDLSKITAEKERVKCLFEEYTVCETSDKSEIEIACKKFLELNGKRCAESYYYDLYSVRCMLVHKLYAVNKESQKYLEDINNFLLNMVIDMLISFHLPQGS